MTDLPNQPKFQKKFDIHKIGGILIKDRKLLICRAKGKDVFIAPGGKVEGSETAFEALKRELTEEVNVTIEDGDIEIFGTYYAPAVYEPEKVLRMDVFIVKVWQGEPTVGHEIEKIKWVSTSDAKELKLGSIFEHEVLPRLKEKNLIE